LERGPFIKVNTNAMDNSERHTPSQIQHKASTHSQVRGSYLQVAVDYVILVAMLHRVKDLLNAVAANTRRC